MKSYTLSDVAQLVDMHSYVINFGTQDNAPDDVRIKTTESNRSTKGYKLYVVVMESTLQFLLSYFEIKIILKKIIPSIGT